MNPEYVPAVGDEFVLWKVGAFAGTPAISLPELPEGLEWDFVGLQDASGVLKVAEGAAVGMIDGSAAVECKVYDAAGICLGILKSTKAEAAEAAKRELHLGSGLYILTLTDGTSTETLKLHK